MAPERSSFSPVDSNWSAPCEGIGFTDSAIDGHLFSGQSEDGSKTNVYEVDPDTNTAKLRFTMDGYFDGLYDLGL